MLDTSRFTPLYIIQMYIDMVHYPDGHIIIPGALLECDPTIEENLCLKLKEIDKIANSGGSEKIFYYVFNKTPMEREIYGNYRFANLFSASSVPSNMRSNFCSSVENIAIPIYFRNELTGAGFNFM